jgi:hypothetical protein
MQQDYKSMYAETMKKYNNIKEMFEILKTNYSKTAKENKKLKEQLEYPIVKIALVIKNLLNKKLKTED